MLIIHDNTSFRSNASKSGLLVYQVERTCGLLRYDPLDFILISTTFDHQGLGPAMAVPGANPNDVLGATGQRCGPFCGVPEQLLSPIPAIAAAERIGFGGHQTERKPTVETAV